MKTAWMEGPAFQSIEYDFHECNHRTVYALLLRIVMVQSE